MEDGVRFIFKTLLKVPIFIVISYLIFNLFSYTVAYFRLYSLAQMVNSVVMENNYVPGNPSDFGGSTLYGQINQYISKNVHTSLLVNPEVSITTIKKDGTQYNNGRVQYGSTARVEVKGTLVWLIPLVNMKGEYYTDGVRGLSSTNSATRVTNRNSIQQDRGMTNRYKTDADGNATTDVNNYDASNIGSHGAKTDITFDYTVPCMKYYSDLAE